MGRPRPKLYVDDVGKKYISVVPKLMIRFVAYYDRPTNVF